MSSSDQPVDGPQKPPLLPQLLLFTGAAIIGLSPLFAFLGAEWGELTGPATAFWRLLLALPMLALLAAVFERRAGAGRAAAVNEARSFPRWTLLLPGAFLACDLATWHSSFHYTSLANATLLANLSAFLVPLYAWWRLRERFGWRFCAGAALAFGGVALLLLSSSDRDDRDYRNPLLGDILALVTSSFYAGYLLSIKQLRRRYGALTLMAVTAAVGSCLLLSFCLVAGERLLPVDARAWWPLLGLALISHSLGQGLIAWCLGRLPAGYTSVVLLIQPPSTALLSWFFLGQGLLALQLVGGAVALVGIGLATQDRRAVAAPPSSLSETTRSIPRR